MALQFDGNGQIDIPNWRPTGDFKITIDSIIVPTSGNTEAVGGIESGSASGIVITSSGALIIRVNSGNYTYGTNLVGGADEKLIIERTGSQIVITSNANSQSLTVPTGTFYLDQFSGYNNGAQKLTTVISGNVTLEADDYTTRIYNFNQPSGGSVLPDGGVSGEDGTLEGFTTGGFVGGGGELSISNALGQNYVYQRTSLNNRVVSFDVTYGGADEVLEYRLLDARDDATELQGWQVFDAAPSGGVSVLSFTQESTLIPIHIEVRKNTETAIQMNDWYVGCNIVIYGQSLSRDLSTQGSNDLSGAFFQNDGSNNIVPTTGGGAAALADILQKSYGAAVCVYNGGVGGTDLTLESAIVSGAGANYWANPSSALFSNTVSGVNSMTQGENQLEFALWIQGQTDAVRGIPKDTYMRLNDVGGLNTLLTNSRSNWKDKEGGALKIVCSTLGRNTSTSTDGGAQGVREAILTLVNADDNIYPLQLFDVPTTDGTHPTDAGDITIGQRGAVIAIIANGDAESNEVFPISASVSGDKLTLKLNKDIDQSITSYSTEGLLVTESGVDKSVTSFDRTSANEISLTLDSAILDQSDLMVYFPYGTGSTSGTLTYPTTTDITLPNSGGTIKMPINNFALEIKQGV